MDTPAPTADLPPVQQGAILEWSARTSAHHDRSEKWYLVGGITVVAIAAYGILTGAWTLAIVAVLCGALYFLLKGHVPPEQHIALYEQGVVFNGTYSTWQEFTGFWLIRTPGYVQLHMERAGRQPKIVIQTGPVQPEEIRHVLSQFLQENLEKRESLLDLITRVCKL